MVNGLWKSHQGIPVAQRWSEFSKQLQNRQNLEHDRHGIWREQVCAFAAIL